MEERISLQHHKFNQSNALLGGFKFVFSTACWCWILKKLRCQNSDWVREFFYVCEYVIKKLWEFFFVCEYFVKKREQTGFVPLPRARQLSMRMKAELSSYLLPMNNLYFCMTNSSNPWSVVDILVFEGNQRYLIMEFNLSGLRHWWV